MKSQSLIVIALIVALTGCEPARTPESIDRVRDAVTRGYDPAANPFAQVEEARRTALAENKHILLVAGGEWCVWCYYLEDFLMSEPEVEGALHDTFAVVHVNFSDDNRNEGFFATLPEADGYPHFWILDASGKMLESQGTLALEDGDKSYDKRTFMTFVDRWQATLDR